MVNTEPQPETSKKSSIHQSPDRNPQELKSLYKPIRALFRWFFQSMGGFEVIGAENIPANGSVIVASNHASFADPPLMACCIARPLRFLAKIELFKVPVIGPLIVHLGAFPVVRGTADRTAIRNAISVLKNGEALLIFPEGNRGDGVTLGPSEKGIAMIALKANAPILPVYIHGSSQMLCKGKILPQKTHLVVRFGKPINMTSYTGKGAIDLIGPDVMAAIAALREEQRAATAP